MPFLRCPTPADADRVYQELVVAKGTALFSFFGSEDPQTGQSWCPDCVTADPVLRATLRRERPELTVHECPVGLRSDWKNHPEHPYRIHPVFQIPRIPTIVLIVDGILRGRLVEGDCARADLVAAFVRA